MIEIIYDNSIEKHHFLELLVNCYCPNEVKCEDYVSCYICIEKNIKFTRRVPHETN